MAGVSRSHLLAAAAALLALALLLLPVVPAYVVNIAIQIGIASLIALGLVMLTGVGGMTSFGQAVFVGLGAYTSAVLTTAHGWSPWATLLPSLCITGLGALVLGAVTVRLSGHFLALGTVAWAVAIYYLFGSLSVLGQHTGISAIPPLSVGGQALDGPRGFYVVVWIAVVLCTALTLNLLNSRAGRALRALRGGALIAEAFGVNGPRAKLGLFVYAALLAGLAGWLLAHFQRSISPGLFSVTAGVEYLLMAVLGGAGQVYGALLGATIVVVLREQLQNYLPKLLGQSGNFETVVFGAALVLVLLVARQGLWPLLARRFSGSRPPTTRPAPSAGRDAEVGRRQMPERGTSLLSAQGLTKRFGGLTAVNDVSFELCAGEIVGLIGPNGAGKSTTFNLLTGVLPMTSGCVRFVDRELRLLTPSEAARLGIGRTFQHVKLVGGMSVLDNVALGAHLRGSRGPISAMLRLDREEERRLTAEAAYQIQRVGLSASTHALVDSLPLGHLRLVEIARALALDPTILLLDEPAAGLRYQEKVHLATLLRSLCDEGVTVLLVEHDMAFVMNLVHRLVVLDFGTCIAQGPPATVRREPAVLAAYLGVKK